MLYHLNLIPSFCFVLSNHYMPLYVLLCGPKIRNKYLVSCILYLIFGFSSQVGGHFGCHFGFLGLAPPPSGHTGRMGGESG